MRKTICKICGTTYDLDEWSECPECAKREYELSKSIQRIKPFVFTYQFPLPHKSIIKLAITNRLR